MTHCGQLLSAMTGRLEIMLETSGRLLRLLSLLQAHRDWPGTELAGRLGVTTRTLRRDVDKLRQLGYPVHAAPGTAGGYRLGAGAVLPPLLLDDEEAVAVAVGLRTAAGGTVAGIEETSLRALAKLEQVLPSRLRERVNALQAVTVPLPGAGPPVDPAVLTAIASAARDRQRIRFRYTGHDGTESSRAADPHHLVFTGRRWYLLAWDPAREDWRTFRADRISSAQVTGPRFPPREAPGGDAAAYVSRSIASAPYHYQARIRLHAAAGAVAERIPPTIGQLEPEGEHACIVRTGAESLDVLAIYVSLIGIEFEVLDPPELAEHLLVLAGRLTRAARG
jgi:predicted DNA-binding transcriptional regulator YafY